MVRRVLLAVAALVHSTSARNPNKGEDHTSPHPCFPTEYSYGNANVELAPCVRQARIVEACGLGASDGNLTSGETQECVCDGSFFQDTIGCGACLRYQDLISGDRYDSGSSKLESISTAYCTGSPTANIESLLAVMITSGSLDLNDSAAPWVTSLETPTVTKLGDQESYFTVTATDELGPGLESLVTTRDATTEAPTSEPTGADDAASTLSRLGLGNLCLLGVVVGVLLSC